jgi:predicted phosphate transport protein (TIGR00153 family)
MGITRVFRRGQKEDRFVRLLIEQAEKTLEGLNLLEKWFRKEKVSEESLLEKMRQKEVEADEIRRILIDDLHNTFVTPLDREDIFNLSLHIDDMLDYAYTTVEAMHMLSINEDAHLQKMVATMRDAAAELTLAVKRLSANPRVAGEHGRRAKKLENEVEVIYREAIGELFQRATDFNELMQMLRRREIYRHVSNMADRANQAADVLGMIVMKVI